MAVVTFVPSNKAIEMRQGALLLDAARLAGVHADAPCGGKGVCGKCLARVVSGAASFNNKSLPSELDGCVLLCQAKVSGDVTLELSHTADTGSFADDIDDFARVAPHLLPIEANPLLKRIPLNVPPPVMGDGLSDADRLTRALKQATGAVEISIPRGVLTKLPEVVRADSGNVSVYCYYDKGVLNITDTRTGDTPFFGVAVDIGTTTVAVMLTDLQSGKPLAVRTDYNAQISCGLDIISRINYAQKQERLEQLREKITGTINALIAALATERGIEANDISSVSVAGNTTMIHLLLGIPPEYIRLSPYTPAVYAPDVLDACDVGIAVSPYAPVFIAPSVGSYVGGDITAGALCCSIADAASDELALYIDIGTNGEILLGNSDFLMGCACSAGPALEGGGIACGMRAADGAIERVAISPVGAAEFSVIGGGKPVGICGSGIISLLAELFRNGVCDPIGKLSDGKYVTRNGRSGVYTLAASETTGGEPITVSEPELDNIIRTKAAIFSACRLLLGSVGLDFSDLSHIYIAGGFGRFLDLDDAKTIGLIPNLPDERFTFLGNASLMGAHMALVSETHRNTCRDIASRVTYIDLSSESGYMDEYMAAMFLPHTDASLFE